MHYVTATQAKAGLLGYIRGADKKFERFCITRNGQPKAVLMSIDDYEGWLETLAILGDNSALGEIRKAQGELRRGKGIPFAKVMEKLK